MASHTIDSEHTTASDTARRAHASRPALLRLWPIAMILMLVGCGGYDPEYDCEQSIACAKELGETAPPKDLCVDISEAVYDNASDSQRDLIDEIWDACKDEKSCDYAECVADEAGG